MRERNGRKRKERKEGMDSRGFASDTQPLSTLPLSSITRRPYLKKIKIVYQPTPSAPKPILHNSLSILVLSSYVALMLSLILLNLKQQSPSFCIPATHILLFLSRLMSNWESGS